MKSAPCRRPFDKLFRDTFKLISAKILVVLALLIFASTVAAIPTEPGSEADGVYTCSQTGRWDFEKMPDYPKGVLILRELPKPVELTLLELKGKTYAVYEKGSKYPPSFHPFSTDGKGKITWKGGVWGLIMQESVYHMYGERKPWILIDYSRKGETARRMTCTKNE